MCGRYSLALRPSQVRRFLEDEDLEVDDAPPDEGEGAPRQSYNFAPGYHGIVYRADVPDWGAGPARGGRSDAQADGNEGPDPEQPQGSAIHQPSDEPSAVKTTTHFKLQSMKWGLIPFWTKRSPDYGSMLRTINCRDDSLAAPGGMWTTMKARKRCIVLAQGFYEWLNRHGNTKDKIPHFVKRADGKLMCFAGLWDCVTYDEDEGGGANKHYTYSIITTDSNKQLKFLHDRMPVILEAGSVAMQAWLDPGRHEWTRELQALLKPYDGPLEVYPVSKEVGKVGNNSPSFMIPVASKENKSNIANFFAKGKPAKKQEDGGEAGSLQPEVEIKTEKAAADEGGHTSQLATTKMATVDEISKDDGGMFFGDAAGTKRAAETPLSPEEPSPKKHLGSSFTSPSKDKTPRKGKISATSNPTKSPAKGVKAEAGTQKITKFFGNSA